MSLTPICTLGISEEQQDNAENGSAIASSTEGSPIDPVTHQIAGFK
jgi:hypothetical protein